MYFIFIFIYVLYRVQKSEKIIQTASLRALSVKNSMNTETTLIVLNV